MRERLASDRELSERRQLGMEIFTLEAFKSGEVNGKVNL
jgi:hypothetical protein